MNTVMTRRISQSSQIRCHQSWSCSQICHAEIHNVNSTVLDVRNIT